MNLRPSAHEGGVLVIHLRCLTKKRGGGGQTRGKKVKRHETANLKKRQIEKERERTKQSRQIKL